MDFRLIEARPGCTLVILPQPPHYPVAAVSMDLCNFAAINKTDMQGKSLWNTGLFMRERDRLALVRAFEDLAQGLSVQTQTLFLQAATPVHVQHTPVRDEEGRLQYIIQTWETAPQQQNIVGPDIEKAYHFFMNAPVIIGFLKGDDYVIELANESLLQVWGRTAEVVGQSLFRAIPELEEQGFRGLLDEVRKSGQPFYAHDFPITLNRFGKEEIVYFDFVYKPYYESEGDTVASGIIAVGHDVTAQVMAKSSVAASQLEAEKQRRLYEAINDNTPDLVYVFGLDYRFTYANKALLEMWGRTKETAIGRNLLENGYEPWHAEMHEREIDSIVATKNPVRGEVSFPHATLGKRIYDYILVPVVNEKGEVEAVAGTTRDITDIRIADQALRESNERFRNLADESPIFIFLIDPDPAAPVSYWNKTWLQYTGQTAAEARGRAWEEIIHPDDIAGVMEIFRPALEQQAPYFIPAIRVKRKDGVYRWHSFKGNPRILETGAFNGYVGVGFDIHEQKEATEALKQSESILQQKVKERTALLERTVEELRRSNANLEEFAYAASHDLKEPVRKVHFFSDRIRQSLSARMQPQELQYFGRMESAASRMNTLIDDLLAYSQISLRPRSFEEVNLEGVIRLVTEDLDMEIEEKKGNHTAAQPASRHGASPPIAAGFPEPVEQFLKIQQAG